MEPRPLGKFYTGYLLAIAFLTGLCVVGVEISSSRLLGPYFGTSIYVWTNIIGVVLAALAVGYYFGGKLSEKYPDLRILLGFVFSAGLLFLIAPQLAKFLAGAINPESFGIGSWLTGIFLSSFLVSLLLFGLPLVLLGMVSPFLIKIYAQDQNRVGEISGKIFFWSTLGSIVGTFLPTLWMIPAFGTKRTIAAFGMILVLTGISGLPLRKFLVFLAIPVGLALLAFRSSTISADANLIYETESAYQYIKVLEDSKQNRYLVFDEGLGIESFYSKEGILTGSFYDYFNLLPALINKPGQKVLIIGLAGGTMARQLRHFFGDLEIDGVEIDQKVVEVAKDYFGLDELDVNVFVQDGRSFLRQSQKIYDLIIVDAFRNELYIPWTMTTEEFWRSAENHLSEDGLLAINVNASADSELLASIANTQAKVFRHVYLADFAGTGIVNSMLVSGGSDLNLSNLSGLPAELKELAAPFLKAKELQYDSMVATLTDDKAPVELMTEKAITKFFR
jgi:spermidine synthase